MKEKIIFNYDKLRGKIIEKYGRISIFANVSGISASKLNYKLNGTYHFKAEEIYIISKLLDIENEVWDYFFTQKVDEDKL